MRTLCFASTCFALCLVGTSAGADGLRDVHIDGVKGTLDAHFDQSTNAPTQTKTKAPEPSVETEPGTERKPENTKAQTQQPVVPSSEAAPISTSQPTPEPRIQQISSPEPKGTLRMRLDEPADDAKQDDSVDVDEDEDDGDDVIEELDASDCQ